MPEDPMPPLSAAHLDQIAPELQALTGLSDAR